MIGGRGCLGMIGNHGRLVMCVRPRQLPLPLGSNGHCLRGMVVAVVYLGNKLVGPLLAAALFRA